MSIQFRIRNWLGIFDLGDRIGYLNNKLMTMQRDLDKANNTLKAIGPGLGRVIAKLDAKYAESEFSPARKAESDKLAKETIKRLEAEAKARAPYNDPN